MDTNPTARLADTHWETKWIAAEGAFDPAYERTTDALRRWLDGMEAALARQPRRRPRATPPSGFVQDRATR